MTAAELFAARLKARGFDWIATLCGHGLDPLYRAARNAGIRLVDVRNEQTAGYIAEAAGRLTGRPGIAATSSAVAQINALTGAMNAWFDGAPMLLISGSAAVRTGGLGHFQDIDQVAVAAPVTKYARQIDHPDRAVQLLDEALDHAGDAPPGPVYLTFPMDVQTAHAAAPVQSFPRPRAATLDDPAALAQALAASERPLIVAGSGIYYAGEGPALLQFAEALGLPLTVPIWDRGIVGNPSPVYRGVLGAATGGPRLLEDADLVIMAGAVPDYRTGYLQTSARIVYQTRGWADSQAMLSPSAAHAAWLEETRTRHARFRASIDQRGREQAQGRTHAIDIIDAIRPRLTPDACLLLDGGSIGQWAHQLLACHRYPGHWLTCGRSGVVGWGLGGAMAARLVYPEAPVILLSGDGAFTFTVAEIECAVRQKLPFVAIVADDESWGITRTGHERQFGEPISSTLGPIAFDQLARSLGARGVVATAADQIGPLLDEALALREVTVIHVPIVGGNPA
ncbi:MAG: thiamine pyrophosphate-binding protein [Acidobacteria bacterium]|nr:thiamine pyrophosphate-binding protein [Acidobacteriota bacterium]